MGGCLFKHSWGVKLKNARDLHSSHTAIHPTPHGKELPRRNRVVTPLCNDSFRQNEDLRGVGDERKEGG